MARPLRIEFAGALYHVTSRGDGRDDIFLDDEDRELWLDVLGHGCERFNRVVHAYCQMGNLSLPKNLYRLIRLTFSCGGR